MASEKFPDSCSTSTEIAEVPRDAEVADLNPVAPTIPLTLTRSHNVPYVTVRYFSVLSNFLSNTLALPAGCRV